MMMYKQSWLAAALLARSDILASASFFSRRTQEVAEEVVVTDSANADDPSRVVGSASYTYTPADPEIPYHYWGLNYVITPGHLGFCPSRSINPYTLLIPNLNLQVGSLSRPVADGKVNLAQDGLYDTTTGWNGDEYSQFLEIPMFNGGKSGQATNGNDPYAMTGRIATAYIAYDCSNQVVCVAAHLHATYLSTNGKAVSGEQIDSTATFLTTSESENWIRFGEHDGAPKLFPSEASQFAWIFKQGSTTQRIGWEGCWHIPTVDANSNKVIWPVVNNYVEIHFSRSGQTTSTGKPASNGNYICLESNIQPCTPNTCDACLKFEVKTPEALVNKFVSASGDVSFRNVQASPHWDQCIRYFTDGACVGNILNYVTGVETGTPIIPNEGIILSSGNPIHFNCQDDDAMTTKFYTKENYLSDDDLRNHVCMSTGRLPGCAIGVYDACFLEFDFQCASSGYVPEVTFNYVFGSEEYYEYVASQFNDAFAFLLNGENIALLPTTMTDTKIVSINNVNYKNNSIYFNGNDPPNYNENGPSDVGPTDGVEYDTKIWYPAIEADGFTVKLTARGTPSTNHSEWNTIKLVIGDVGDGILDSWVLLESGTFSCVHSPTPLPTGKPTTSNPTGKPTTSNPTTGEPTGGPTVGSTTMVSIEDPRIDPTGSPTPAPVSPTMHPTLACA